MATKKASGPLDHTPSVDPANRAAVSAAKQAPPSATAVGVLVGTKGAVPAGVGLDRAALTNAGFTGAAGSVLAVPAAKGAVRYAIGIGDPADVSTANLRDAAAAFA